jgi:hypothetical protein
MAYGSSYKSGSGVGADTSTTPGRPPAGSGSPMRGVSSSTLPATTIDEKRKTDNAPLKFPEDLTEDFYISFNTYRHATERPPEAYRSLAPGRTFDFKKPIILPLPTNLTDSASAGYSSADLYYGLNLARSELSSLVDKKGIAGTAKYLASSEGYNEAIRGAMDKLENIDAGNLALGIGVQASSGSGIISAAMRSVSQLTANPFPVMIFQGTNFKPAFTFDWVLYPESASEANTLKKIIGFFRREMLPERKETNTSILKTPSVFEIKITPAGIGRTFKRCVLTNMGVNYAPNGPSFIVDAAGTDEKTPSSVAISLTFQEIEVWLANDYYLDEEFFFGPRAEFTR